MRDRLLSRCAIAELLDLGASAHLEQDHQRDEREGQRRGDGELGADSQVLNEHHRKIPGIRIVAATKRVNSVGD
ncbi:hypothetical protein ACVW1A_004474 [Bradyrhizobium sp. LB1.3]